MKIIPYDTLHKLCELGKNAELFIDQNCFDVSDLNTVNMMTIYEPEILKAEKVELKSEQAGNWWWNRDRKKWERRD